MTSATWYLVRYMPDLQRREPRNVGLVLRTGDGSWLTKFVAERPDGTINGYHARSYAMTTEIYKTWVDYFRRKANDRDWRDVEKMRSGRPRNYFAEMSGEYISDGRSPQQVLDELFANLVEAPRQEALVAQTESPLRQLLAKVDFVLSRAGVKPERDVTVAAKFGDNVDEVPFRYAYVNGQRHLMDVLGYRRNSNEAARDARELRTRVQGARDAGEATSFIAFYDHNLMEHREVEHILRPVEDLSLTIDVGTEISASETLQQITAH